MCLKKRTAEFPKALFATFGNFYDVSGAPVALMCEYRLHMGNETSIISYVLIFGRGIKCAFQGDRSSKYVF